MPSLAEIKSQIKAYKQSYIFWTQKEIKVLPEILNDDESLLAITSGMIGASTWLAVCTNRRLIFLNSGMFFGLRQVQYALDRIQSLDHSFTIVFGSISVWDGASSFTLNLILKDSIRPFVKVTQKAMQAFKTGMSTPQATAVPSAKTAPVDVATQIAKLAALKDSGHLTEEEFQQQKRKLLG